MPEQNRLVEIITQLIVQEKAAQMVETGEGNKRMKRIKYLSDQYFRETGQRYRFPTSEEGQHEMQV